MFKNSSDSYGLIAQLFHIIVAILIIGLFAVGLYMADLPPTDPNKFPIYGLHKSFGLTVLLVMIGRVCWRLYSPAPHANPAHKAWEVNLAHAVHYLLYGLACLIPLSGWLMSNAAGYPAALFGITMPTLLAKNEALREILSSAHTALAYGIIALVVVHVAGAVKHQFIDKDNTLRRMFSCPCKK